MIKETIELIIRKSELMKIDRFLKKDFNSFEEIPIFSRDQDINQLLRYVEKEQLTSVLISIGIFFANNLILQKEFHKSDLFVAITICNLNDEFEEMGYVLPNLFILNKKMVANFLTGEKEIKIKNYPSLYKCFKGFVVEDSFRIYKTITKDKFGEIERIFLVAKKLPKNGIYQ